MNHYFNGEVIASITLVFLFFLTNIFYCMKIDKLENKIKQLEKQVIIYQTELNCLKLFKGEKQKCED